MSIENRFAPIADRTLWDSNGNKCRAIIYPIGNGSFELYLQEFNESIPVRYIGSIGLMNNKADLWIESKKQAGFQEQLPSYSPIPIN